MYVWGFFTSLKVTFGWNGTFLSDELLQVALSLHWNWSSVIGGSFSGGTTSPSGNNKVKESASENVKEKNITT